MFAHVPQKGQWVHTNRFIFFEIGVLYETVLLTEFMAQSEIPMDSVVKLLCHNHLVIGVLSLYR